MNAYFVFLTQVTVQCLIHCRVQINQGAISDTTALWAEGDGCGVGSSHTVDRRWEDCLRPSRCVCVSGIIIPALYSQQITSDLYVGVNPGMTRGRSSTCCICSLSVCGDLAVPTVTNTMRQLSLSLRPPKASRHPPGSQQTDQQTPFTQLLDHNIKGINSLLNEWISFMGFDRDLQETFHFTCFN